MNSTFDDKKRITRYPSARLAGMKEFMSFLKEPDWRPVCIDSKLLKVLEMAKGREAESVHALRFLGIIDNDGKPTEQFDQLKQNYQETLRKIVFTRYSELLKLIPARMMNQRRLVRFFGTTTETAEYQAKFFAWLCEEAGIDLPNLEKKFHRARFDKKEVNS